jgi:hypothetical protein
MFGVQAGVMVERLLRMMDTMKYSMKIVIDINSIFLLCICIRIQHTWCMR